MGALRVGRAHVESENMLTLGEARESSWQALEILGGKGFPRMERKQKRTKTLSIQKLPWLWQFIELYRNYKNSLFSDLLLLSLRAKHKKASGPIKLQSPLSQGPPQKQPLYQLTPFIFKNMCRIHS